MERADRQREAQADQADREQRQENRPERHAASLVSGEG